MLSFNTLLVQYGLLAIFLFLLTKSVGFPIPIPADVILLATAAGVAQRKFILWQAAVVVLVAMVLGGYVQFLLARGPGRGVLFRFGRYVGLTPARVEAVSSRIKKGGIFGMSISALIPGVRGVAIAGAGLADLPLRIFLPGLVLGTTLFLSIHFVLGYIGGSLLSELGKLFVFSPRLLLVAILLLLVFGLWLIAFYRQKAARKEVTAAALQTLHEGICPVCLAMSAVGIRSTLLLENQNILN
jgi:membrane protein DedA with SNARE-associated domain